MEATPTDKRYSGRVFDAAALEQIRGILRAHAGASRQQLSYRVCEALDWRKADGSLKDMSCRVALLRLYREGLIELPAPRRHYEPLRSYARRTPQGEPGALIEAPLSTLGMVRLELVERAGSALWNELIDRYHYLGYKPLPGAQLRYFAYAGERLVAVLGFGAAAWQTAPRDEWIGWSSEQRQRNFGAVVNNARFLILPWIRVPHLASKLLGLTARTLPAHWQARYGYRRAAAGDLRRGRSLQRHLLPGGELGVRRRNPGPRQARRSPPRPGAGEDGVAVPAGGGLSRTALPLAGAATHVAAQARADRGERGRAVDRAGRAGPTRRRRPAARRAVAAHLGVVAAHAAGDPHQSGKAQASAVRQAHRESATQAA